MLKMPQQQYIKFLREAEGCSIREISQQMGIHWRTAKRYADQDNWNQPLKKKAARHPVMGPYIDIVNTWLEEDQLLPRKQRHTGVRIFHRLREEHQFPGGQRTVLAYVRKRKQEMQLERAKTYERLEHPPGEAQVDKYPTVTINGSNVYLNYDNSFDHSVTLVEGENKIVIIATNSLGKSTTIDRVIELNLLFLHLRL